MGINNGKFFDAKATSTYFSDIETEFNSFKTSAISHLQSQNELATTPYWQGYDAELAKKMLGEKDATLLQDILDLQTSMVQLQNDILEKFRWDVDSDYDARIEYDTLEEIDNDFIDFYNEFNDNAKQIDTMVDTLTKLYGKYGSFTSINNTGVIQAFADICSAVEPNTGYMHECMNKLANFDDEATELILDTALDKKIADIASRLNINYGYPLPLDAELLYCAKEDNLRSIFKDQNFITAKEILEKNEWTQEELENVSQIYRNAVETQNIDILELFINSLMIVGNEKNQGSGENTGYISYVGMDYGKIIAMQQTLKKNGVGNSTETIISLGELACMYYTQESGNRIDNYGNIELKENTEGILISWKLDTGGGNIYQDQRMIFKPDDRDEPCTTTETLQKRYDSISNISGLNEYRTFLKTYKDLALIAEYESVTEEDDFKEHSKYVSTLSDSIWDIGKFDGQYEYINDTRDGRFRMCAEHDGMKYATVGLDQMTDEQIAIYNYLYYYDKEEAEAYITLIQPYLGTKKAYEKYGEIKDSTFQKTMFEFGAGTESIFTGIENCFGGNDDLDGIPMQTVTSKVDGLIMSDAGTVESKIYGISKIGGTLLPAAAVSVIPGAAL